jgi:hypothetical protein
MSGAAGVGDRTRLGALCTLAAAALLLRKGSERPDERYCT